MVEVLDASGEEFTIESLDATDFCFNAIKLSPKTLKDLYDKEYMFDEEFRMNTQSIWLHFKEPLSDKIHLYLKYLANQFIGLKEIRITCPKGGYPIIVFGEIKYLVERKEPKLSKPVRFNHQTLVPNKSLPIANYNSIPE